MRKSITDEQSPAFQFYASDWISDPNRMKLSLEEQGAYILLYCHCWRSFRIPKDMEVLSRMCNCREKFNTTTSTSTSMTTITTECFINGEKVTKDNSVKVIFNKLKSRQRKKDVQNAIKEKKILKKANKNWVLN